MKQSKFNFKQDDFIGDFRIANPAGRGSLLPDYKSGGTGIFIIFVP